MFILLLIANNYSHLFLPITGAISRDSAGLAEIVGVGAAEEILLGLDVPQAMMGPAEAVINPEGPQRKSLRLECSKRKR